MGSGCGETSRFLQARRDAWLGRRRPARSWTRTARMSGYRLRTRRIPAAAADAALACGANARARVHAHAERTPVVVLVKPETLADGGGFLDLVVHLLRAAAAQRHDEEEHAQRKRHDAVHGERARHGCLVCEGTFFKYKAKKVG